MTDEIPKGWKLTTLSQIAEINPRHPKVVKDNVLITFVPMAGLSESSPNFKFTRDRKLGDVRNGFTHFAEGDVLFAKITPCMENGKGAVASGLRNRLGCGTTELHVIRPLDGINPHYIYWYLARAGIRRYAKENFTGTAGQARVPTKFIADLEIPLAPVSDQERIVEKLNKIKANLDFCQERLIRVAVCLKRFRQSVLSAACSGRLTADWREVNANADAAALVRELLKAHEVNGGFRRGNAAPPTDEAHDLTLEELPSMWRITDMQTAVCPDRPITYGILKPGPDTKGGIPYIRVADFPNDTLDSTSVRRTTKEIDRLYARARLRADDVLLSIRGTVGRVCVVPPELQNANITQDTARLSIQSKLNLDYVLFFLRAASTQKRMQKAVKGVAVRGINIGDVRALQLAVPPLLEQIEIVRRVKALFEVADRIEARHAKAKERVHSLSQSVLAQAFRGRLVLTEAELAETEGRSFESADELLERIEPSKGTGTSKERRRSHRAKRAAV